MEDKCCILCDGGPGNCRSQHKCYHHKQFEKQQAANDRARRTHPDPVADEAIRNVMAGRR